MIKLQFYMNIIWNILFIAPNIALLGLFRPFFDLEINFDIATKFVLQHLSFLFINIKAANLLMTYCNKNDPYVSPCISVGLTSHQTRWIWWIILEEGHGYKCGGLIYSVHKRMDNLWTTTEEQVFLVLDWLEPTEMLM